LFGATGQVGHELALLYRGEELVALDRYAADLSRPESLRAIVREVQPEVILNAAAYTAVDRAETEVELAELINHRAPAVLAEEAERLGAMLLHYSTDYVFDGSKREPWIETDTPAPINAYGATKLAGEQAIAHVCSRYLILRTSWVYAARGHNFLRTMMRLARERAHLRVVNDQWGAPTPAPLLAEATHSLLELALDPGRGRSQQACGIYHVSCGGKTNWCEFARAIFAEAGLQVEVDGISSRDYPTPAKRPHNSVLSNEKLIGNFDLRLPVWQAALKDLFPGMTPQRTTDPGEAFTQKISCA
jgi:dTDP-4-dehydrorhamnose reductase